MIQFTCSNCQVKFMVSDHKAGQKGKCPKCGEAIEIPSHFSATPRREDRPTATRPAADSLLPPDESDDIGEIPLADEADEADERSEEETSAAGSPMPSPSAAGLVVTTVQEVTVVDFQYATILDASIIDAIAKELYALVDQRARRKIILNFQKVRFLSSQMLGVLITLQKKSAAIKGRVVLCGLRPELRKVFSIMKLEKVLTIASDESTAKELLGSQGRR